MSATGEKIVSDVKVLASDTEELVRARAAEASERLAKLEAAAAGRAREALEKAKSAAAATDQYVHVHPWMGIGIAAGIGLILGLLIGRR